MALDTKFKKLKVDDDMTDVQSSFGGFMSPPISPYSPISPYDMMDTESADMEAPVGQAQQPIGQAGEPIGQTEAAPAQSMASPGRTKAPIGRLGLTQPVFGQRSGTGASQTGKLAQAKPSRLGATSNNGLTTNQPTFGNRAGTGASQTGILSRANERRMM
jgi:hypothetical protein